MPDSVFPPPPVPFTPPELPGSLLPDLLAVSLTGIIVYAPLYDDAGTLIDFRFEYLNPAAQRMMTMPERPTHTHTQQWPQSKAHGALAFHIEAFATGEPRYYEVNYQADGYDNYYRLAARRSGEYLLVSFTDTADQPRTAVEVALREAQARERAALAEVEHQRATLYRLFEQAPAAISVLRGPQHIFEFANSAYQATVGARTLVGSPFVEALPELADQPFVGLLDKVYRTGEGFVSPEILVRFDYGHTSTPTLEDRFYSLSYQARRTPDGAVDGIISFAYDVTAQVRERRQVEVINQELETRVQARTEDVRAAQANTEAQRERLHRLIAEMPAMIARLRGPEHVIELVNDGFRQIFGGRPLEGKPYRDAVPELVDQPFFAQIDAVYRTGETHFGADQLARLDRTNTGRLDSLYFDYTFQATRDGSGQIDGVLIFAIDVTERVLARRERDAQRQRLHDLFMQAQAAICILAGPTLVYELVNPGYQALFPERELQGRCLLDALPEIADHAVYTTFRRVYETGIAHEEKGILVPFLNPTTGALEARYFNYIQQARLDEHGQPDGVLVFAFEVTEQALARQQAQALADELAATNAQLTRTNIDLDNFIYTASHDLAAPITNIDGLLEVLEEELPPSARHAPAVAPVLTMMHDAVARFRRTIADLTEITRLQQEVGHLHADVPLAAVLDDVRLDLAPLLAATGAHLTVDVAACPSVAFSAKNLRSVLYNLLSNALKYRHPGRPVAVRLTCHSEPGHAVLRVQDNGLGLSAAQQNELFTMFRRLHPHVPGSGIGLYMVKRSVENSGGRVTVESESGVGSTFSVYFPR